MRNQNTPEWEGTKRVRVSDIQTIMKQLDDAYFALADQDELIDTERPLLMDMAKAKEIILSIIKNVETMEDVGIARLDEVATDIQYAVAEIKKLKITVDVERDS